MAITQVPQTTFGIRLYMARRSAGLEQTELGQRVGVSGQAIGRWERDEGKPRDLLDMARKLSDVLSVPYEWLLLGADQMGYSATSPLGEQLSLDLFRLDRIPAA